MNTKKLRVKMLLADDTMVDLASYLGITENSLSYKMNQYPKHNFKLWEIVGICNRYKLTPQEMFEIFVGDEIDYEYEVGGQTASCNWTVFTNGSKTGNC